MVAPMHEQRQEVGRAQVVCSSDVCDGGSVIMKLTEHRVWSRSTFFFPSFFNFDSAYLAKYPEFADI